MTSTRRGYGMPRNDSVGSHAELVQSHPDSTRGNTAWVRLRLTAELTEDAHLGSGSGGAGLDALVTRDRDGRPVIWATHIEGLLRDTAHRLDGAAKAEALFGRRGGQRQRMIFTSLYATEVLPSRIWRSSARVSFENRAPKDDTLRAMEYVPRGTRFEAWAEVPALDVTDLERLMQALEAVGHGRATGAGRVRLALQKASPACRRIAEPTDRLLLLLRNLDPMCLTATAMPGNIIPSFPFIPGRTVFGALANWLVTEGRRDAAELLVGACVSVTDALPVPAEPMRLADAEVLPAPLSLRSEKPGGTGGSLPWWSLPAGSIRRLDAGAAGMKDEVGGLKRPEPDLFVCRLCSDSPWETYRPSMRVRLRSGKPGGPDEAEPALFAIEQIAERTMFLCELRGSPKDMASLSRAVQPLLEGIRWLRVGRGGAPMEVARSEWAGTPKPTHASRQAYLILTSDLLVRDSHLRWLTALDAEAFQRHLGWPPDLKVTVVAQDASPVDGFNGTSRLWRLPAVAVRRGSVFRVEGQGISHLMQAAADGRWLGERTHEGFGRFRLDETLPGTSGAHPVPAAQALAGGQVPGDPEEIVAVTTRCWLKFHGRLANAERAEGQLPSLSQWQDLVTDLDRAAPDAVSSRKGPETAGKAAWRDADAQAILAKLENLPTRDDRVTHARMFVRWLRAEMRRRSQ